MNNNNLPTTPKNTYARPNRPPLAPQKQRYMTRVNCKPRKPFGSPIKVTITNFEDIVA